MKIQMRQRCLIETTYSLTIKFQFVDEWIDKIMNIKQQEVAQMNMVEWLSDSQELGKKPSKIEFVKKFELYKMH